MESVADVFIRRSQHLEGFIINFQVKIIIPEFPLTAAVGSYLSVHLLVDIRMAQERHFGICAGSVYVPGAVFPAGSAHENVTVVERAFDISFGQVRNTPQGISE
ncbi:hypothetical protein D9M69_733200 [compost metagenome]